MPRHQFRPAHCAQVDEIDRRVLYVRVVVFLSEACSQANLQLPVCSCHWRVGNEEVTKEQGIALVRTSEFPYVQIDPSLAHGLVEEQLAPVFVWARCIRWSVIAPHARRLPKAGCHNASFDNPIYRFNCDLDIQYILCAQAWDRSRTNVVDSNRH